MNVIKYLETRISKSSPPKTSFKNTSSLEKVEMLTPILICFGVQSLDAESMLGKPKVVVVFQMLHVNVVRKYVLSVVMLVIRDRVEMINS